jgi:Uma2 family endonuclease
VTHTNWEGYLKILEALGDDHHLRITYDRGVLELLSPTPLHERIKRVLGSLVECLLEELGRNGDAGGSTTFRRESLDRGLEPDECYWLHDHEWGQMEVPPPDLAIEVDITSSSLNKLDIYASLGVGEVWRWNQKADCITVFLLSQPGVYEASPVSRIFPHVPMDVLPGYVRLAIKVGYIKALREFRAWVRTNLDRIDLT